MQDSWLHRTKHNRNARIVSNQASNLPNRGQLTRSICFWQSDPLALREIASSSRVRSCSPPSIYGQTSGFKGSASCPMLGDLLQHGEQTRRAAQALKPSKTKQSLKLSEAEPAEPAERTEQGPVWGHSAPVAQGPAVSWTTIEQRYGRVRWT